MNKDLNPELWLKLESMAKEAAQKHSCVFYDLEYNRISKVLTLYIDKAEKEQSVGLEDCSNVSSAFGALIDAEDLIPDSYDLEVSSPGLDRHLNQKWHFEKVCGAKIQLKLKNPLGSFAKDVGPWDKAKNLNKVILKSVQADSITVELDQKDIPIAFELISNASVVFDYK